MWLIYWADEEFFKGSPPQMESFEIHFQSECIELSCASRLHSEGQRHIMCYIQMRHGDVREAGSIPGSGGFP